MESSLVPRPSLAFLAPHIQEGSGKIRVMVVQTSLAKPDPSIARGSGRKPILRFVPAAGILQSNQIAERAITTY